MTDHYATLGVAKTASPDEIKQAFRRLASKNHPDKGGDTAKFQQIQAAYDTLGDAAKRAAYDNPAPQFSGFGGGAHFGMHDIFGQMFGGASPFGNRKPNHVRMSIWISLTEVAQGGHRTVNVGTSSGSSTVQIEIPKGIDDGDNVQYGGVAPNGMDLVVQFRVQPDPKWQRQGLNLVGDFAISVWDLILGSELQIETIKGQTLAVAVPPNTQPGTVMRLRGHGLENNHGQKGDSMIRLVAQIPKDIAPEIVAAIRQHRG